MASDPGAGLSCYTANLLAYLEPIDDDALGRMARSVRTAVRVDLDDRLLFSHHRDPLDRLGDGDRLAYAGTVDPGEAIAAVGAELERYGRVLVVADSAKLPWSPARTGAPHWLLVDARVDGRWHVVDRFCGLLPDGPQEPFDGWLGGRELVEALRPPGTYSHEQLDRNALAFGYPTALPDPGTFKWLVRRPPPHPRPGPAGTWLDEPAALDHIAGYFADDAAGATRHLDDVWAAARHQVFRLRWLCSGPQAVAREPLEQAAEAWESLPQALRFALESARRGRPRPRLVHQTVHRVAELQARIPVPATPEEQRA
jgi:hypothetical protein